MTEETNPAPIEAAGTPVVEPQLRVGRIRRWWGGLDAWIGQVIRRTWPGAAAGAVIALLAGDSFLGSTGKTGFGLWADLLILPVAALLIGSLGGLLGLVALELLMKLPKKAIWILFGIFSAFQFLAYTIWSSWVVIGAIVGELVAVALARGARKRLSLVMLAIAAALVVVPAVWFAWPGTDGHLATETKSEPLDGPLDLPDPTEKGSLEYGFLTYGSGTDRHRDEYGASVTIKTDSVDASEFMPNLGAAWKDGERKWFWGFDGKSLPLNARVWYPKTGAGPFPLVLIVHGNHQMEVFSDGGYDWLGEHLAGRGYLFASVDENFFNGNWVGDYSQGESYVRGWLLLKHLDLWKQWNATEGNPFFGKVDLSNIALIGHSRGGQAVVTAGAMNPLNVHPEDGNRKLSFHHGIRSIISIAPNDPYQPSGWPVTLTNVNFLTLFGGHDSDATGFWGQRPYFRTKFTDGNYWCKSAVYIYRGNHGQFNTVWGRYDQNPPARWVLNTKPLMSGDDQRKAAKAFITAFLEATLRGQKGYLDFLRDPRRGRSWLPEDIYATQFEDTNFRLITDYMEDIDQNTTTLPGGRIQFDRLKRVSENMLETRGYNTPIMQKVVFLGWERKDPKDPNAPYYSIELPDGQAARWELGPQSRVVFSMCNSTTDPKEVDLSVELEDQTGTRARCTISEFRPLHPPMISRVSKAPKYFKFGVNRDYEQVLQTYELPIDRFRAVSPQLDPGKLKTIRFVFDQTNGAEIMLTRVGVAVR